MTTVKLYLETRTNFQNKEGKYPIYIRIYNNGLKKDKSLRVFVNEKNWVKNEQRIVGKNLKAINDSVQKIKNELIAHILEFEKNDIEPIPDIVYADYEANKKEKRSIYVVQTTSDGWKVSLNNWFKFMEKNRMPGTVNNSRQFKTSFMNFVSAKRTPIRALSDINYKVSNNYRDYLFAKGMGLNTVGKLIARLRAWLHHENKTNNTPISNTKNFNSKQVPKSYAALTVKELRKLINFQFDSNRLSKARDVFIAITFTGLRISDYINLDASLIEDGVIKLRPIKTLSSSAVQTSIPVLKEVREILKRNEGQFPQLSESKLREYIKEACELVGFDQIVEKSFYKTDNEVIKSLVPKYSLITPHTGIKTMANYLQDNGLQTDFISNFLKKSEKTLKKHYLKEKSVDEMKKKLEKHGLT